jgi:hypothetical protein
MRKVFARSFRGAKNVNIEPKGLDAHIGRL